MIIKDTTFKILNTGIEGAKNFFISLGKLDWFFLVVTAFSVVLNVVYSVLNRAPQIWDSAAHINLTMLYAQKIEDAKWMDIPTLSGYYPPFIHLVGSIFFMIFRTFNSPLVLSYVFFAVALIAIYKIALELTKNKTSALFAVSLFCTLPQVYREARLFELDLPLTMLLLVSFAFLFKSRALTKMDNALLFFIFAGFAQLTKWYAFVYLPVPFIFELVRSRNEFKNGGFKKTLLSLISGAVLMLLITCAWYYINYKTIMNFFGVYSKGELSDPQARWSVDFITEYLKLISVYQLFFVNAVLVVIAFIGLLIKRIPRVAFYIAAFLVPYLVFTSITNKDVRYVMPLLPIFVLILSDFFLALPGKAKGAVASIMLVLNLGMMGFVSFNQFKELPQALKPLIFVISGPIERYQWVKWNPTEWAYQGQNWQMQEAYEYISKLAEDKEKENPEQFKILFGIDYPYFNKIEFDSLQIFNKKAYKIDLVSESDDLSILDKYDVFVTSYNPGPNDLRHYEAMVKLNRWWPTEENTIFEQKTFYRLPNGEDVFILAKKSWAVMNAGVKEASESGNESKEATSSVKAK